MNGSSQRGFTLLELLVALAIFSILVLLGVSTLATRPGEARAAALGFQALLRDAHATSQNNGDASRPLGGTGATIAVSELNGETVLQLYRDRQVAVAAGADLVTRIPPLRTHASLRLINMKIAPPFLLEFSPTGFISVTSATSSGGSGPKMNCLTNGVIVEFSSSTRSERHTLNCLTGTIDVNDFLPENASS